MSRWRLSLALLTGGCLSLFGCGHSNPATPSPSPNGSAVPSPETILTPDAALIPFEVVIDPVTLTGTVTPIPGRAAVAASQGFTYDLDIDSFLKPNMFQLSGIDVTAPGDLELTFAHRHPFPAVDVNAPAVGMNRADLGYTGRLLVLADESTSTFFGGTITLDGRTVLNPDGFINPGDLLHASGFANNTFPYMLLVDEVKDNRLGISNGGSMTGNYTVAADGWQRSNVGLNGDGWVGYDYLHGGQTIEVTTTLSNAALLGTGYRIQVALLIKYTDPKGVGTGSRRLPGNPVDPIFFAYRCPHAALDCSVIGNVNAPQISPIAGSQTTVTFDIRDWDSSAPTAGDTTLADEQDVSLVLPGSIGVPTVTVDCPALNPAQAVIVPSGPATGVPGDEIPYDGQLTNTLGTATTGVVFALVRAVDKEDGLPASVATRFGVDPVTLAADTARALQVRTYQLVHVDVQAAAAPVITNVTPTGAIGRDGDSITFSATATNIPTSWSWNFGGGASPNVSGAAAPSVAIGPVGGPYSGTVTATNGFGSSAPFPFSFTVLPFGWTVTWGNTPTFIPRATAVTPVGDAIYVASSITGPTDVDPSSGGISTMITAGGTDACVVKLDADGFFVWGRRWGGAGSEMITRLAVASNGDIITMGSFQGTIDFDPGPSASNLTSVGTGHFVSRLTSGGNFVWADAWSASSTAGGGDLTLGATGDIYVTNSFINDTGFDLDPGLPTVSRTTLTNSFADAYIVHLTGGGVYVWGDTWGSIAGTDSTFPTAINVDAAGDMYAGGQFQGIVDFDPGIGLVSRTSGLAFDAFINVFNAAGTHRSVVVWGSPDEENVQHMGRQPSGTMVVMGYHRGPGGCDINPGPGIMTVSFPASAMGGCYVSYYDTTTLVPTFTNPSLIAWQDLASVGMHVSSVDGAIYNAGWSSGADLDPGAGSVMPASANDPVLVKLTAAGAYAAHIWHQTGGFHSGNCVTSDGSNRIYWGGSYGGGVDFYPGPGSDLHTAVNIDDGYFTRLRSTLQY